MKSAHAGLWLLVAMLFLLSFPASSQTISGFARGEIDLDMWGDPGWLDFEMGVEYSVGAWSFGAMVDARTFGLDDMAFAAGGSLGAFNILSFYTLDAWIGEGGPVLGENLLGEWKNVFWFDIAGTEFWSFFGVREMTYDDRGTVYKNVGAGLLVGGHSAAGALEIWAEAAFNASSMLPYIYWNGLPLTIDKTFACDLFTVSGWGCDLAFSHVQFYVDFPFYCTDATAWIEFDGTDGFTGLELSVVDLPIGDTGLSIARTELWFWVEEKDLGMWFDLDIGEVLCIEPFITLDVGALPNAFGPPWPWSSEIEGIEFAALQLSCTLGNVTIRVSELFSEDHYYMGVDGAIYPADERRNWPLIHLSCVEEMGGVWETIAIEVNREGCCGGDFFFGLYNYFHRGVNALFDWLGVRARAVTPVTTALSTYVEAWFWHDSVGSILLGFDFTWGTLQAITSDWDCCKWTPDPVT